MKGFAAIALVGLVAVSYFMLAPSPLSSTMENKYAKYIAEYRKNLQNGAEYEMRLKIFSDNVRFIEEHNAKDSSYKLGLNQFTDWTNEEYRRILGYKRPLTTEAAEVDNYKGPVANSVDWVAKGAVNAVQDQGSCGSCWAFGTIGAVEGAHFVKTNQLLKFSEQELVDCCHDSCYGCSGGFQNKALKWLQSNGLCLGTEYRYTAKNGSCQTSKCSKPAVEVSKYVVLGNSASALKDGLNQVPVSVTVDASCRSFQHYSSGVLTDTSCPTNLNHAVLGFAYGTDSQYGNYFTIKNSWGSGWGDKGYIRIAETTGSKGICGIYMDNSYAVAK